jgi:hypothetical protein
MGAMTRLLFALVLAFAVAATTVSAGEAKTPCRNLIYNDWYQDGKIASTYPISCYRDALSHIGTGDAVYTSLEDDIRAAMQAALARLRGETVANQVGRGFNSPVLVDSRQPMKDEHTDPTGLLATTLATSAASESHSGMPVALLVLGGLALVLLAAGGVGTIVRRRR